MKLLLKSYTGHGPFLGS
uniref:Uncharacterized protein n=1 Tax=Lepeophtheirus salmonis TaxID=72036 RepID=A0A0K2TXP2_LEPSM